MEKTGLRRSHLAVIQDFEARSHRTPAETELRFHFHSHHGRVGDENFPACFGTDRTSGRALYHALRVGHVPSWLVAGTFIVTFAFVIGITIYVSKKSSGEITEFGAHRSLWRI